MVAFGQTAQRTFRTSKVNIWYICKVVEVCNQHYNDCKALKPLPSYKLDVPMARLQNYGTSPSPVLLTYKNINNG